MAKRQANPRRRRTTQVEPAEQNAAVAAIMEKLPEDVVAEIKGMRGQFAEYGAAFRAAWAKREELCDSFFKLYGLVTSKINCTFVQFVGLVDPSVPIDQRDDVTQDGNTVKGYRTHPSYQAALYMQRLQQQRNRDRARDEAAAKAAAEGRTVEKPPRNLNATERLARTLKTILQVIRPNEVEQFWAGIGTELDLDKAGINRLRKETNSAEPILRVPTLAARQRFPVRIMHMVRPGEQPAAGADAEAGRNVERQRRRA